jgi:hypothetical protein
VWGRADGWEMSQEVAVVTGTGGKDIQFQTSGIQDTGEKYSLPNSGQA